MARGPLASLDKGELFARYMETQRARENSRRGSDLGLGSMFQEEGPGRGPSAGLAAEIASIRRSGPSGNNRFSAQEQRAMIEEERRVEDRDKRRMLDDSINPFVSDLKSELAKMRSLQGGPKFKSPEDDLNRMALAKARQAAAEGMRVSGPEPSMTLGAGANELSPLDMIAENLQKAQTEKVKQEPATSGAGDEAAAQKEIAIEKKYSPIDKKMNRDAVEGIIGDRREKMIQGKDLEDAFFGSMEEYLGMIQQDVPELGDRDELMERYRKEFTDATGIDASGKIDKSQALMAMGLALMQNRAGKGFNVGNILSSIGEAGQAAMPYLDKARDEAKQARIAAGKYALGKIKSDEDARDAIIASNEAIKKELFLKNYEAMQSAKEKILEARLAGKELEMPENIYNEEIKIGSNTYKMRMGINARNLMPVFVNPVMDSSEIASAYNKTVSGINSINEMESLTRGLIEASKGGAGGLTGRMFLDRAQGVMKSMGINEEQLFASNEFKGLSAEDNLDAIRRAFIMRFKRFISQETGNGISNVDVAQIEAASGALDKLLSFKNPEASLVAFGELRKLFDGSLTALQPVIRDFTDRDYYYEGEAGDKLYNKTMQNLQQSLSTANNVFMAEPQVVQNADGSQSVTYDVRRKTS